ncbi:MAG: pantetheine-phosphate adenylyltransferase [Ruminococcaceae bacterium]|nr:pantetheine-phosphate adenylyltransferase [Oscillospiraceae bacterium]MBQ8324578.1 pantetheine-phosphate adenylyltransferase [Clostridia bacterium]
MRTAVITGMFDPFTRGHENLVRRSLDLFDQVVIVISRNAEKQGFLPDRVKLDSIWACFPDKRVQVVLLEGLLAEFVKQFENPVLVRGARNGTDFEYEAQLRAINMELGGIETVILPSSGSMAHISSTYARELIRYGRPLNGAVPTPAANVINRYLNEKD